MKKETCTCGCECSEEEKKCFHEHLSKNWDLMPDELKDKLHSLMVQKQSVLTELKEWAENNNLKELAKIVHSKLEKIEKKIKECH